MDKQKKQLIVIGVGIIILIFVMAGNLKKKPAAKPKLPAEVASAVGTSPVAALPIPLKSSAPLDYTDKEKLAAQKEHAKLSWGRDPFSESQEKEYRISELELKGISFAKGKKGFAFINNEIVSKGDRIGDYEIVEVEKDRVLLKKGNQNFYIAFPQE